MHNAHQRTPKNIIAYGGELCSHNSSPTHLAEQPQLSSDRAGSNVPAGREEASESPRFTREECSGQNRGGPPILTPYGVALFWSRVAVRKTVHECWEWKGPKWNGYGRYLKQRAHKIAYELFFGPVPDDLLLRHRCDNPPCCNPYHLLTGTISDNMQDAVRRGQFATGKRHGRTTITEDDALYIRRNPDGKTLRELSAKFGIALSTCHYIRTKRSWKRLT